MAPAHRSVSPDALTIVRDSAIIVGDGTDGPFWVTGFFVLVGTESVAHADGSVYDTARYHLDYDHGYLSLNDELPADDTLLVHFQRLAFALARDWTSSIDNTEEITQYDPPLVRPVTAIDESVDRVNRPPSRLSQRSGEGQTLRWQGFKSFSVSTSSSHGSDWSQGLEFSIEGDIADGVRVRGAMSDRFANSSANRSRRPVTRVGDLDRIFLEAQSERFYGRFGQVSLPGLRPQSPPREAAGGRVSWDYHNHAVDAYFGRAVGTPIRHRLTTQPQIAGPYQLSAEGTLGNVLPASVTVVKDGIRLSEGNDKDYTLDVATGTITFGPAAVPDAGSIVFVEYERVLADYQRSLGGVAWETRKPSDRFQHQLAARWEADDPEQPLTGDLTDAQRALLGQSPTGEVAVPSYEYRGNDEGDYELSVTESGDTLLSYVGPGNGDWRVRFEYVGLGQGRYRHLAEDAFEYVGLGTGSYEPSITLGAPRAFLTLSESVRFSGTKLGSIAGEWYGFADDPNRFAADNTRRKSNHHLAWSTTNTTAAAAVDRLSLDWWRHEAINDRTRTVDDFGRFTNAWQLRESLFDDSRSEYQMSAASSNRRSVHATLESGVFRSPELDAVRWSLTATARPTQNLLTTSEWSQRLGYTAATPSSTHDSWRDLRSSVRYMYRKWTLKGGWHQRDLSNPRRSFVNSARYVSGRTVSLGYADASLTFRHIDSFDSLQVRHRNRELAFAALINMGAALDGHLQVARGVQSYGTDPFTPYYRGRLDGGWRPHSTAALNAELDLTHTRSGVDQEVYLPTRPGQGQYRLERGEYVPDVHGDYRRVVSRADAVGNVGYEGRQTLYGHWRPTIRGWRWAVESRRDRLGRHDPSQFAAFTWLAPWTPYTWDLAAGARAERHDYHRLSTRPNQRTEITLDWTSDHTVFGIDRVRNVRDRLGSTVRRDLGRMVYLAAAGELETRERSGGSTHSVNADATTTRLTLGGSARDGVTWSLEGRRRIDRDHEADANIRLQGLKPRMQAVMGGITILIESDLAWVTPQSTATPFSSLLVEGRPAGFSAVEFCEVRWTLPGRVTLKSRFHADLRERDADRWRWDVQTVARF